MTAAPVDSAFLRLINVNKIYHTPAGDFPALKGISAQIARGDFVGIVGKSGAGKSTLINMLAGVDHLSSGEIWMDGAPIHALSEEDLAVWRSRNVGVVYQSFQLMPQLTLMDNVMLPMDFSGLYHPRKSRERALQLLRDVELEEHAYKRPAFISGGQQQRVAIARALANDPPLVLADEPTGNLDSVTAETIYRLFDKLAAEGRTVLMVSHDVSIARRVKRIFRIVDGELKEGV
ncbi:MAG: ABC transporter ATP-binding protein [Anaerolineales bacterium]